MSSDRTFYINKADLRSREKRIKDHYWESVDNDWALEKLLHTLDEEVQLGFRKINIVIVWVEFREECDKFRNILNKYKIEFQETE